MAWATLAQADAYIPANVVTRYQAWQFIPGTSTEPPDNRKSAALTEASVRLNSLPWKADAPGAAVGDRFTSGTLPRSPDIEYAFYLVVCEFIGMLGLDSEQFEQFNRVIPLNPAISFSERDQSAADSPAQQLSTQPIIVHPVMADLPFQAQVILEPYLELPQAAGGAGVMTGPTPFDILTERMGTSLYERQADGTWKQVITVDPPPLNDTVIREEVEGELYERQADGTWRKVAGEERRQTRTIRGKLYERQDDGTWKEVADATTPARVAAPLFEGAPSAGPAPDPSQAGVDQTARDAAAAALRAAQAAQGDADTANTAVTALGRMVAAIRAVPGAGAVGQVLARIAGAAGAYGWRDETAAGGGGVDQTARDAAAAAQQTADAAKTEAEKPDVDQTARDAAQTADDKAEANKIEIGRNSQAVVLARQEAAAAKRTADAAQEEIPDKATNAVIDAEVDNDDYVTTHGVFRAIARKLTAALLDRIPSANPGANKVWKTDGSGDPGWRDDETGGGSGGGGAPLGFAEQFTAAKVGLRLNQVATVGNIALTRSVATAKTLVMFTADASFDIANRSVAQLDLKVEYQDEGAAGWTAGVTAKRVFEYSSSGQVEDQQLPLTFFSIIPGGAAKGLNVRVRATRQSPSGGDSDRIELMNRAMFALDLSSGGGRWTRRGTTPPT